MRQTHQTYPFANGTRIMKVTGRMLGSQQAKGRRWVRRGAVGKGTWAIERHAHSHPLRILEIGLWLLEVGFQAALPVGFFLRYGHIQRLVVYQLRIHFIDGLSGLFWGGQLHKAHPPADTRAGVPQHLTRHDGAKLLQARQPEVRSRCSAMLQCNNGAHAACWKAKRPPQCLLPRPSASAHACAGLLQVLRDMT